MYLKKNFQYECVVKFQEHVEMKSSMNIKWNNFFGYHNYALTHSMLTSPKFKWSMLP